MVITNNTYEWLDIGNGDHRFFMDVNEDGDTTVLFVDELEFHERYLERELDEQDLETALRRVRDHTHKSLDPLNTVTIDWLNTVAFEVSLFMGNYEGLAVDKLLEDAWDFIAACLNLSDPGTFGCEYMFDKEN